MPDPTWRVIAGDCRTSLASLPAGSVQTCVTSPPYFGLRDYGTGEWEGGTGDCDHVAGTARRDTMRETPGGRGGSFRGGTVKFRDVCGKCDAIRVDQQIGLEPTPDEFVTALVDVFRSVRRVLRDDGTVWLNLGDSYASGGRDWYDGGDRVNGDARGHRSRPDTPTGCKPKDLLGIPWMVAFALRADGWYLRSDVIWAKPNPMPESVTDRPTKAHEYLFLLSKGARYYYDADAIKEPAEDIGRENGREGREEDERARPPGSRARTLARIDYTERGRNKRSVWTVATQPFPGAHFATFPPKLIEPCILAGSSPKACGVCGAPWQRVVERTAMVVRPTPKREAWQAEDDHARTQTGGTMLEPPSSRTVGWESSCEHDDDTGRSVVLDPFAGSGTVGVVCGWHGRDFIGLELSETYAEMARDRITAEGKPWRPRSEPPKVHADQLDILSALGPG
jgi:DNA modification methylase